MIRAEVKPLVCELPAVKQGFQSHADYRVSFIHHYSPHPFVKENTDTSGQVSGLLTIKNLNQFFFLSVAKIPSGSWSVVKIPRTFNQARSCSNPELIQSTLSGCKTVSGQDPESFISRFARLLIRLGNDVIQILRLSSSTFEDLQIVIKLIRTLIQIPFRI